MTKVILKTKELQWWRFWTRDLTVSLILCLLLCQSANLQLLPSSNEPKGNCFSINARLLFPITEKWAQVVSRLFISFSWLPHQLGQKFEPNFTSLSWTRFSASRLFIKFFLFQRNDAGSCRHSRPLQQNVALVLHASSHQLRLQLAAAVPLCRFSWSFLMTKTSPIWSRLIFSWPSVSLSRVTGVRLFRL